MDQKTLRETALYGTHRLDRYSGFAMTVALLCWLGACTSDAADPAASPASGAPAGSATPQLPGAGTAGQAAPSIPTAPSTPVTTAPKPSTSPTTAGSGAATPPPTSAANGGGGGALPCDVSKVLAKNCQNCHGATPIGGAPMALMTYADLMLPAKTQPAKKVYELVHTRIHDTNRPMPPNTSLVAADTAAIDSWVAAGAHPAVATETTACATTPMPTTTDKLGPNRDRDFSVGRLPALPGETCYDFKVHGSTTSVDDSKFPIADGEFYEQFYYKVPWPADTVATAYATVADNAQVLHHWLLFSTNELQPEGAHIRAPLPTLFGTDPVLLAGWAVGGPNVVAPDDVGFVLPDPGRTINVQWHFYNTTGKPQTDGSTLQVCTVPKPMRKNLANVTWAGTEDLNGSKYLGGAGMPPHKESTFTSTCNPGRRGLAPNESIHIIGFEPHMHRIGKRMTTSVKRPDGTMEVIFDKPFTFGSETHYPMNYELKPGEQLVTSCTFNNDNDFGVPFGESTDTEMCYQFTWAYPAHALSNGAVSWIGVPDTCW